MAKRKLLTLYSSVIPTIGTFGRIVDENNREICKTVEREWLDNKPSLSCICAGSYKLTKVQSPKFGPCYALTNADLGVTYTGPSTRTHILLHAANYPEQLLGCIAPGLNYMEGKWGVSSSKKALVNLEAILDEYMREARGNVYMRIMRNEMS